VQDWSPLGIDGKTLVPGLGMVPVTSPAAAAASN
jgi:hypothetical protein